MQPASSHSNSSWAIPIGLLAGSSATLLGVLMNLSPEMILLRSVVAGVVATLIASLFSIGWKLVSPASDDEEII
ncbi:hypothetical protein SH668x_000906 [Planctomicrobium sp. SH668]|uniref:hypothetical protein n=1 Tax=Planctomicrobium sp. SH668 TaxID=3448126 RepID=UPI003F5B75F7